MLCICNLRGPLAGAERSSRVCQGALNSISGWMRAAEHASRRRSYLFKRVNGFAEIIERGVGVHVRGRRNPSTSASSTKICTRSNWNNRRRH